MAITLTYDATLARVRIDVDGLDPAAAVLVERSTDQVRWTTVRGASAAAVTGGALAVPVDDYEFAPDIENFYRVRALLADGTEIGPVLDANPFFEGGVGNWTGGNGGTLASSGTQHHQGSLAARLTPNGSTANTNMLADEAAVTVGVTYAGAAWLWSTAAFTWRVGLSWYDSSHTFLSSNLLNIAMAAGTWTNFSTSAAAPAGAAFVRLTVQANGTPAASNILYVDQATLNAAGTSAWFTGSITPDLGGQVWLKSVARPFLNRPIVVQDFSDITRPSRGATFAVVGRADPIAVTEVRGSKQWTLTVPIPVSNVTTLTTEATESATTLTDDALDAILAAGDIMLVQVPAGSQVPGGYVLIGDVTRSRKFVHPRYIWWQLPCAEVAAPGPDVVGATSTWQTVLDTYATWGDLLADNATWGDLLELIGSPVEVTSA